MIPKENLVDYMTPLYVAQAHHRRLVSRLRKSPIDLQKIYHETFEAHLKRGEIVELSSAEIDEVDGNFITPVLVYKPDRAKTKLRICWNLSLKNKNGKCINDAVLTGLNLIKNLLSHILNLRKGRYLILADIEKAFMRIKYLDGFTKYFKLLYAKDLDEVPKLYKMVVVLFGLCSSPFSLNRTLSYHIEKIMAEEPQFTSFCITLFKAFYLDDLGVSFSTKEEAALFVQQAIRVLKMGNFRLTQWVASDQSILAGIDPELIKPISKNDLISLRTGSSLEEAPQVLGANNKVIQFGSDLNPTENESRGGGLKCLGISYSPYTDKLFFEKETL